MRRMFAVGIVVAGLAAAGCGGGSTAASAGGGILRVGTTATIDSLNPFVAFESQSYNTFVMEYPQLVQYGPGFVIQPDWATSWKHSADNLTWTFKLRAGTKWSDGRPMTAADAAWTAETILKYASGPAAALAGALTHVKSMTAPDATTLVVRYDKAIANVLPQLSQFWVLPEHVWNRYTGNDGRDLKGFRPEQHLPTVTGGPYTVSAYNAKGTTIFKRNPNYYGPRSHADAVVLTYYTNPTTMIADLTSGNLDFVDQVPYNAVNLVKSSHKFAVNAAPSDEVTDVTFNSNPLKPKNRELLDWRLRQALEYATDRSQIVNVVYAGFARPWANMLSRLSAQWLDPTIKPLPFDTAKANVLLDRLGYRRGSDGTRVVPATTGAYAQPAHKMEYDLMVPGTLDFNGDRTFQIIANGWKEVGVILHEVAGGDTSQSYGYETAGSYTKFDLAIWDWTEYVDPDFEMSYMTRAQWFSWNDTGYSNPQFNRWYLQQATLTDPAARKSLIFRMERQIAHDRPYIQLVSEDLITANRRNWTGFYPTLNAYCKCYYTSPHSS